MPLCAKLLLLPLASLWLADGICSTAARGMSLTQSAQRTGGEAASAAADSLSGNANPILRKAIQLHQSGEYAAAIRQYRLYLERQPQSFLARANLGAALAHEGDYRAAIVEYRKALVLQPHDPHVELNLALAHYKELHLGEAAVELESLHAAEPTNLNVALLLGDCYFRLGEYRRVVQELAPIEPQYKEDRALLYLLGTALIRDGQVTKGQALVDKIMRNGDSAEAHLMLGEARLAVHDDRGALDELSRALKLSPRLPLVHSLYARALLEAGDQVGAMENFRQELAIDPNEFESNLELGFLLNQDHHYAEAIPYVRHALRVRPNAPDARYQLAIALLGSGKLEDARRELEALVRASPNFIEAHVSLGRLYYRLGLKSEGNQERAIVTKLNAQAQSRQAAANRSASQQ